MDWVLAGIAFGFLGSFHCIGMCGPLALSLPGSTGPGSYFILKRLLYNFGRVFTYALLGSAVGLFSSMVSISGYQQWLSIGVGVLMILAISLTGLKNLLNRWKLFPAKLVRKASSPVKSLFGKDHSWSLFVIGVLNGFLPCGFVYLALATALTLGTVFSATIFMTGFGLGTIPAMLGVSLAGGLVSASLRRRLQRFSPYFIAFVGILLILRGLNLGIPFISPRL